MDAGPNNGTSLTQVDVAALEARWDRQQERYIVEREQRFDVMVEAVALTCGTQPVVADLGCGLGSLVRRIKARIPKAHIVGLDADPVLLRLARALHPETTFIETDLTEAGWSSVAGLGQVDAFVSTTALHWLDSAQLRSLMAECFRLLRPGGLLLNGDHFVQPGNPVVLGELSRRLREAELENRAGETWSAWWTDLAAVPGLEAEFHARAVREAARVALGEEQLPEQDVHTAALRDAGFKEVVDLWRVHDDVVLAAVK